MKRYAFPYRREYSTLIGEIYRPTVTVYLQAKNKRWVGFTLYADSGADITLLPKSACKGLGYNLKAGEPGYVGGITRGRIKGYIHEISMKLGEEALKVKIAFSQTENVRHCWVELTYLTTSKSVTIMNKKKRYLSCINWEI